MKNSKNAVLAAALLALAPAVQAADYPTKAVRMVIAFTPGGPSDILSRLVGGKLAERMGQPFVFDNRPGAGGNVAGEIVATSPADGYTLMIANNSILAANASLYKKMTYDPMRDLIPVSQAANALNVLVVHPSVPAKNVKEMIAIAKARPGQMNYGSSGPGATDHLAGELFNVLAGVKMVHVPYKGGAPAMLDLVSGNVQVVFSTVSTAIAAMDSKRVRPLAMTGNQRFELMPELPTVAEAGLKGFEVNNWYGIFLPAGTPKDIVTRLNADVVKALAAPDVKKRLLEAGIVATSSSPEGFMAYVKAETAKWAKVIKDANISVE